jgi:hypothetical protein
MLKYFASFFIVLSTTIAPMALLRNLKASLTVFRLPSHRVCGLYTPTVNTSPLCCAPVRRVGMRKLTDSSCPASPAYGRSKLFDAVVKNDSPALWRLIKSGANLLEKDKIGNTLLTYTQDPKTVGFLIHEGLNPLEPNKYGKTPYSLTRNLLVFYARQVIVHNNQFYSESCKGKEEIYHCMRQHLILKGILTDTVGRFHWTDFNDFEKENRKNCPNYNQECKWRNGLKKHVDQYNQEIIKQLEEERV